MDYKKANSIDPKEIATFTKEAAFWWDENGPFKPLHVMNPTRLTFIREEIIKHCNIKGDKRYPFQGINVLDIGCGGGLLSEPLARLGATVTGLDAGTENIEAARHHAQQHQLKIDYHAISVEEMSQSNQQFDVVIALEIVEHVANVASFINSCCALTKPGGLMIFSTLNRTLKSFALGIIAAEYILRWVPRGTHSWQKFIKPSELTSYLRNEGTNLNSIKGINFNPFRGNWQLTDEVDVNYLLSATKM